ncbi:MAG: hypothetical protein ACAF42_18445 [Limnothrix sp. BL-A-16]
MHPRSKKGKRFLTVSIVPLPPPLFGPGDRDGAFFVKQGPLNF